MQLDLWQFIMKTSVPIFLLAILLTINARAQFAENFTDGDYANNPTWIGNSSDWIVNTSQQLQSNNTTVNSSFFISTASNKATVAQWEFFSRMEFNPSSTNYIDIYVVASAADISLPSTTGYFVRLGGTDDEISLYRKDNGTTVKLIDGVNGILNSSLNDIHIKLQRDAANNWKLSRKVNSTANFTEGAAVDAVYQTSSFFGILVKQSTASFFQKHYFDDIIVGDYVPDTTAPQIQAVTVVSTGSVDILFNEPVELASAQQAANYYVDHNIGFPASVTIDNTDPALVHLTFLNNIPVRTSLQININAVKDLSGNAMSQSSFVFTYYKPLAYDIIIDELMADPTPVTGLPDVEWIELKNTSSFSINLQNWRIGKPTGISGAMPAYILKPDSMVVIGASSSIASLQPFGPAIAVGSFPTLNNTGDQLYLLAPDGTTVHAIDYSDTWYGNELKKQGGWSLEMIDTRNPCNGSNNWKASEDALGGTPGKINAVDAINPDESTPKLMRAYTTDSLTAVLVFNEPLDSTRASAINSYSINDGIGNPVQAIPQTPFFNRVELKLPVNSFLQHKKIYTVTVNGITDCTGNAISNSNTARVGLNEHADSFDVVINEILFNPKPTGNDYVELYNRSSKIINLKYLYIANRNSSGEIDNIIPLSSEDYLLFPGDYLLVTESKQLVLNDYITTNPDAFIEIGSTLSYNDDAGDVIVLNEQGRIMDEVKYTADWHFKLIIDTEGVSLERIDFNAASQSAENWHSAATNVGYGTPGYKNSQYRVDMDVKGSITISPEIVSPDNDGLDDFATINYSFPEPGYVCNIVIFDVAGRPVRNLQRNALCGTTGYFRWDGLGEHYHKLPVGMYIIYSEIFNLQGKTKKFKSVIVLARKN